MTNISAAVALVACCFLMACSHGDSPATPPANFGLPEHLSFAPSPTKILTTDDQKDIQDSSTVQNNSLLNTSSRAYEKSETSATAKFSTQQNQFLTRIKNNCTISVPESKKTSTGSGAPGSTLSILSFRSISGSSCPINETSDVGINMTLIEMIDKDKQYFVANASFNIGDSSKLLDQDSLKIESVVSTNSKTTLTGKIVKRENFQGVYASGPTDASAMNSQGQTLFNVSGNIEILAISKNNQQPKLEIVIKGTIKTTKRTYTFDFMSRDGTNTAYIDGNPVPADQLNFLIGDINSAGFFGQ